MSFEYIADGFVYFSLKICPNLPLEQAYEMFTKFLTEKGIDPHYEDFLLIYLPAEAAREASIYEQTDLLNSLKVHPYFLSIS